MPDTAVVTGAARGIGRAIATRLAREGWQLVIADLDATELDQVASETGALAVPGDTSTDAGVRHLVDAAYDRLGHVDVFFANAGTDVGRVNISIAGCVWYVSNNAAGNAGTSTAWRGRSLSKAKAATAPPANS